jgi:hypothetical protein
MSMPLRASAFSITFAAALAACGGGGGGGGGGSAIAPGTAGNPVEVGFSSFAAIGPNQTVVMSGVSRSGSGSDAAFNLNPDPSSGTIKLTYDGAGNLSAMTMSTPGTSLSYSGKQIIPVDTGSDRGTSYLGFDGKSLGFATDPASQGWNYQSFGIWMSNLDSSPLRAGAISAGAVTPGSARVRATS